MKKHKVKKFKSPNSLDDTWYHKRLLSNMKKCINKWFCFFCENTSLHGFRYISIAGSTVFEIIFWLVICVSSIIFCVILMGRILDNYRKHPIATTIDTSNRITQVSFPGVTICNHNKVYRPQAEILAKLLHEKGFTEEESEKFFHSLPKLVEVGKVAIDNETALRIFRTLNMSVETLMERLMQPCSALLLKCAWIGEFYDCNKIFRTVKSNDGFCCAFNFHYNLSLDDDDVIYDARVDNDSIDSDGVVLQDLPGVMTILNASGNGRNIGLTVALNVEPDMYNGASRPYVGASVMVHDPIDFPTSGLHVALPGHSLLISVSCTSITAKDTLRNVPIDKRSCYLDEETHAKISNEIRYNYESCLLICRGKVIVEHCGCLPFHYPTIQGVRTCYLSDVECLWKLEKMRSILAVNHTAQKMIFNKVNNFTNPRETREKIDTPCMDCLPECTDLLFRTTAESIKLENIVGFECYLMSDLDMQTTAFVQVFFDDMFYIHYYKENTVSWDVLLASLGGIFGLCLGGSVMSVIELIYLLIREFFKRQFRKRREASLKNLPPASEIFLSVPGSKKAKKPRRKERFNVDSVAWYQSTFHRHEATSDYDAYYKHKF